MKMNALLTRIPFLLAAAALFTPGLAVAETVIIPSGVDNSRGGSLWIREDGQEKDAFFAGVIFLSVLENGQKFDRDSLCVDLFTDIYLNQTYGTTVLRPDQVPGKNLGRVSWLVDNALLPTQGPVGFSELPTTDWVTDFGRGAGIQLAIWDIVHDNGDGFDAGAGRVQAAQDHVTDAEALLWARRYETLSAGKSSDLAFVYNNISLSNGAPAQMLVGPMFSDAGPKPAPNPITDSSPAPDAPTMALTGSALISLSLLARRLRGPGQVGQG